MCRFWPQDSVSLQSSRLEFQDWRWDWWVFWPVLLDMIQDTWTGRQQWCSHIQELDPWQRMINWRVRDWNYLTKQVPDVSDYRESSRDIVLLVSGRRLASDKMFVDVCAGYLCIGRMFTVRMYWASYHRKVTVGYVFVDWQSSDHWPWLHLPRQEEPHSHMLLHFNVQLV